MVPPISLSLSLCFTNISINASYPASLTLFLGVLAVTMRRRGCGEYETNDDDGDDEKEEGGDNDDSPIHLYSPVFWVS